jgi:hypothetical protein
VFDIGDRDSLPALSLRGRRPDQPPALRVSEPPPSALATVLVERALVQATIGENNSQNYRVRLLLHHVYAPHLDLEFPAPLLGLNLKARLLVEKRGLQVNWQPVDENGQAADNGRIARVPIPPDFARRPLVLDLSYQVLSARPADSGLLQTTLSPPVLHSDVGRLPVRFQVHLPANWVPLYHEGNLSAEQRWGWRGLLLGPLPALSSADLERWFFSGFESRFERSGDTGAEDASPEPEDLDPATLVCSRPGLAPLRLNHCPQQVWLLLCSMTLLAIGLGLYLLSLTFARRVPVEGPSSSPTEARAPTPSGQLPRAFFWSVAVVLALAVVLASLFWPGILGPVLYGAEPGALVLVPLLGLHWLRQQRYRRQVVFLPGFTRMKPGSSLVRNGSSASGTRPRGEPSTVDAPPPPISNAGQ